ncbi:serine/threonine-protein phosphatase 7 long form homolog [Arachis hypogaea]|uniref:serine/threonine-protein phosphatase 7 long form homolog n=1 Tax=Arachis hypogaea TaxID=3818 RepID=UPI003B226A45
MIMFYCYLALVNALIEKWCSKTHTFNFSVGEYAVTLEDVVIILSLPTNGLPVTGPTLSSYEALEAECFDQFGVAPRKTDCRESFIKLTWFRGLKDRLVLVDDIHIQSWGSACLAHLYRVLCRATRVDCKEIDLSTISCADSWWRNWERADQSYRFHSLAHFRRALDYLQERHFIWEAYAIGRIDPDVIPFDIRQHSIIWSATVPLIYFECIEWHAYDRLRRQFGLTQGIPHQERDLGEAHGEVLTGPKNQDWSGTHSF